MFRSAIAVTVLPLTLLVGCASSPAWLPSPGAAQPEVTAFGAQVMLAPAVATVAERRAALSSADVWSSGSSEWLIAASPDQQALQVFDARSGALLRTVAPEGDDAFDRPHHVHVIDNLALVAEREGGRVHLLQLPEFTPLLRFGHEDEPSLIKPQSIWGVRMGEWGYHVYITDNYPIDSTTQSNTELRHRVKQFALSKGALGWSARTIRSLGETGGDGQLYGAGAIVGDVGERRLVIADTDTRDVRRARVYGIEGRYSGRSFGGGVFRSQISGLALLTCGTGNNGLWLATDGGNNGHYLHAFDRDTLDYRASFLMPPLATQGSLRIQGNRVYTVLADGRAAGFDLAPIRALKAGC